MINAAYYADESTKKIRYIDMQHRCVLCRLFFLENDVLMKTVSGEVRQFAQEK